MCCAECAGLSFSAIEHADIVSTEITDSIIWYHFNDPNHTNYYTSTVSNQGVDPKARSDVFSGRSWGGAIVAEGLASGAGRHRGAATSDISITHH